MRSKIFILVAMLAFLIYGSSIVYVQAQYPGYDKPYNPLIGGIQIQISTYGGMMGGYCSLAFPVKFKEGSQNKDSFITAGHCINIEEGRNYVHQPNISGVFWWNNLIGIGIRNAYPHGGGNTDLDGALIRIYEICERFGCYTSRSIAGFIFENGDYLPFFLLDSNKKVGITGYITPTKEMERNTTIVYKSGKTTGVTYGKIIRIDYRWEGPTTVEPTILITRCPDLCYYYGDIARGGDSGGVVYIRHLILWIGFGMHHYGAIVLGIANGASSTLLVASWAVKVRDKWPELNISYVTCGSLSSCL
jgi:hypothetical protein